MAAVAVRTSAILTSREMGGLLPPGKTERRNVTGGDAQPVAACVANG